MEHHSGGMSLTSRPSGQHSIVELPFFVCFTACASAGQSSIPSIAQMPADANPAIWKLSDEDTTIYLFGTIHLLKPGITWFDSAVKEAFDSSDELVIEMIQPEPAEMMQIVNELAIDKTGVTLRDKLSPEARVKYEAAMTSLNLPVNSFDPLKPWFASVSLSVLPLQNSGYATSSGVEEGLISNAKSKNMKIIGLETAREQLGFFNNLNEDVQIRFLNSSVDTLSDIDNGMNNMVAEWANANTDALAKLMNAGLEEKILYDTLLVNRNANWAAWLDERMKQPGTVFVAVGAGHLAGPSSVQAKLTQKGFVISRIKY